MNIQCVKRLFESFFTGFVPLGLTLVLTLAGLTQAADPSSGFEGAAKYRPTADPILEPKTLGQDSSSTVESKIEFRHLSAAQYNLWITVGDNDGYGYGSFNVPDGATLPFSNDPDYNWLFDNRSSAELADLNARHTDYQSFGQGDFMLQFSFDPATFLSLDTAWINIDISGLQQNAWADSGIGPTRLYFDGVEAPGFATINNQGAWGSGVFTYGVPTYLLGDGVLNARFDLQISGQYPFFDPFSLDYATLVVSGNLAPPSIPVLISPSDGSTTENNFPTFAWGVGSASVAYDLQVDDDPAFNSPIINLGWYDDTVYTDSSSIPNGTYYWRVGAWGPIENWSGWSTPSRFEITGSYRVPSEFPTIQAAIYAIPLPGGGEVLVAPGTYTGVGNRNIGGFGDRSVQVRSESGPGGTIVDCQSADRAFYFDMYTGAGTVIDGFTIRNGTRGNGSGGTILCESAWPTINNCVIENCSEGGIYAINGSRPTITNCTVRNNYPSGVGTSNGGNIVVDNCDFYLNDWINIDLTGSNSSSTISNSTFSNQIGGESGGFGIAVSQSTTPTIQSCTFEDNLGHGFYAWQSTVNLDSCIFIHNGQTGGYGGGSYIGYSTVTMTNCEFEGNVGSTGGGIYLFNSSLELSGNLFDGNSASVSGGAIYVSYGSTITSASGCTFVNNSAENGSSIYIESAAAATGSDGDGGSQRPTAAGGKSLGGAQISECLFVNGLLSPPIFLETYAWIEIMCSDIYGNAGGDWTGAISPYLGQGGNISADPLFCDAANNDYTLTANSPCAAANNSCNKTIGAYGVGCSAIELSLSPTPLAFTAQVDGLNPTAQNLQITNLGGSLLHWTLTKTSGWLQVNSAAGTAPATVSVSVDKTGLPGGIYYDTLVVLGDDAINSPQLVPVMLTLTAGEIAISPSSLGFAMTYGDTMPPDAQTLTVSNSGSGLLSCQLSYGQPWLQLSETQFSVNPPRDVSISILPTGLAPGTYQDTIVIASDNALNSPQIVGVTLTVTDVAPPTLVVGSSSHPITAGDTMMVAVNVGDNLSITFVSTSPLPGVVPILSILSQPVGSAFDSVSAGVSRFAWSPVPQLSGTQYITIIADDEYQTTSLVVGIAINSIPQFTTDFSDKNLIEGEQLTFIMNASDNDPVQPTISWNHVPATATFDNATPGTATLRFTPDYNDVDTSYEAAFTASDGIASVTDTLYIDVTNRQLTVQAMQPSPGAEDDILISDSIQIQFNEAIDPSTLSANLVFTSAKGTTLGFRYVSSQNYLLIGAASGYLEPRDTIGITLNTDVQDMAGYPLDQVYVESFVTGAAVYPGDANDDGVVDGRDILPLGLFWGNTGPARGVVPDLSWTMAPGHIAFGGARWTPADGAFADADGSGAIDPNDICGVTNNWSLTHTVAEDGKRDDGKSLITSISSVDETVLQALYAAIIECPESQGRSLLQETLEAALGQPSTETTLPASVELYQNYPNPFNPLTTIRLYLPTSGKATLSVYNMLGQRVATLINGSVNAGYIETEWDGTDQAGGTVASGIYFYRLETSDFSETKRMLLLK